MRQQTIIASIIEIINQLPEDKAEEISNFADFIIKRYNEQQLINSI